MNIWKLTPLGLEIIKVFFSNYLTPHEASQFFAHIDNERFVGKKIQDDVSRLFSALIKHTKFQNPPYPTIKTFSGPTRDRIRISQDSYLLLKDIPSESRGRLYEFICLGSSVPDTAEEYGVTRQTLYLEYKSMVRTIQAFNKTIEMLNKIEVVF